MTISKKLLLVIALGLGVPFSMQSGFNDPFFASSEHAVIASYMPILRNQTTVAAEKVVRWLDKRLRNESLNKYDATTIVNILESPITIETKIADIHHIITSRKAAKIQQKQKIANASVWKRRKQKFANFLGCMGLIALAGLVVLDATTNPYPRCQACICNHPFYLNGVLCRYEHTCRPRGYHHHRRALHVHVKI